MTKKAASNITSCITIQEVMFESIDLPAIQALFALLYILVCTAAIVGNALVLYVVTFAQVSAADKNKWQEHSRHHDLDSQCLDAQRILNKKINLFSFRH